MRRRIRPGDSQDYVQEKCGSRPETECRYAGVTIGTGKAIVE